MISIDTLRLDRLARFGGPGTLSFLDGLVADGVVLTDHVGCSNWTYHATTCTVAGADPLDLGFVPTMGPNQPTRALPTDLTFLSTWLSQAGYQTVLVTTNPVFSGRYGNGGGYDDTHLLAEGTAAPASVAAEIWFDALEDLDPAAPWFAHLHVSDPHRPYVPPEAYRADWEALPVPWDLDTAAGHDAAIFEAMTTASPEERAALGAHLEQRYASAVAWLDDQLAAVWAQAEADGWLEDTWVVVWTDHGEQHFERGYQAHAYTLYPEENDALGLFWARDLPPGEWTGPTSAIDLAPTLLDRLGIPIPPTVTGVPLGLADPARPRFAFTYGKAGRFQSVRQGSDTLIFGWSTLDALPAWQHAAQGIHQYDRHDDPAHTDDRYDPASARTQALWSWLRPEVASAAALLPEEPVAWPEGLP